jgi:hypothetical protein
MHKMRILAQESLKSELQLRGYGLWKLLGAKWLFQEGFGVFLKIWEWLKGLGTKDRPLAKCGNFSGIFG